MADAGVSLVRLFHGHLLHSHLLALVLFAVSAMDVPGQPGKSAVKSYEGTITIPTYEHSGRELEPPLFASSTVTGMYPFTTYLMPFKAERA